MSDNGKCDICGHGKEACFERSSEGYICTREKGHLPPHIACAYDGGHAVKTWFDDENKEDTNADTPRETI